MRLRLLPGLLLASTLVGCADPAPAPGARTAPPAPAPAATAPPAAAVDTDTPTPSAGPPAGHDAQAAARVAASMERFAKARSFHAEMTLEGSQHVEQSLDFVAPDRYRLVLPAGPQVIIGSTLYLQAAGRLTKVPVEQDLLTQWRDPLQLQAARGHLWVQPQGQDSVDGALSHKYQVVSGDPQRPVAFEYWIDPDGRPLQLRHRGQGQAGPYLMTLRYSRLDDPTLQVAIPE
ncbi:hypothetical protein [Pseudoxanthomonas composti]|uniref:hypothetical protein n=1 Tax=Pseudoxanthomonas composti TaxID=2137479 RepID=UPI0019D6AD4C|nr:hypothetical protein [Pseudoxanthomonas composti]